MICIDANLDPISRWLKITHELGHFILHDGIQADSHELVISWQESQTNHFVEHLIMPYYMLDRFAYKVSLFDAPMYMAQLFRVPERMAKQRFNRFR